MALRHLRLSTLKCGFVLPRHLSTGAPINASALVMERTSKPRQKVPIEQLKFGKAFTDHMLEIDWTAEEGWLTPMIVPHHALQLDPASSSLHYALQCFEGMKAYRDKQNRIRLFRPDMNMKRLNVSAQRLLLPTLDHKNTLECLIELLKLEKEWIPQEFGYSLYIRPTLISTHPFLGVGRAERAKFYTILSPVGPYYPEGFNAITLYADAKNVRAWPGGSGFSKVGANYGPTILPQIEAAKKGYTQVLWLFGKDFEVTEVGTMNQFFFWKKKDGSGAELVTAPLDGTILAGVTRHSILTLAREWGEFDVAERKYTIKEVIAAIKEDRIIEAFGSGTAAIVSPVKGFHFDGTDYKIPLDQDDPGSKAGKLTKRISETIMNIQYGKVDHPWSVVVD